jgi:hypothetical protein
VRTTTAAERGYVQALLAGHHSKFEVQDADGVYRDYTSYLRTDWFTGATIEETIDQSTVTLNATLLRGIGTMSLSPFKSDSIVNRNAGGSYATAIDLWRKWKLSVAVMPPGYPPSGSDWKELCQGRIDTIEWSGDLILITGRGEEAVLLDFWISTERAYGSVGGIAMETTEQSMIDDNLGTGVYTLYTPSSPSYLMNSWTQQKGNLFPALTSVSDKAGFVTRFRYDSANSYRPTLFLPNRTATPGGEVWTIGASEITGYRKVAINKKDIRNFVKLKFAHPTLGTQTVISPQQAGVGTVSCAAGTATFSSSQAAYIKTTGSKTEIIVAGIAYTINTFNGTTGATLISQSATGGVPTFAASSFTLSDTVSGSGTGSTTSIDRFGRVDLEIDVAFTSQVNDPTKAQAMCDAVRSDTEFPNVEQEIDTLGFWFVQLHDYGRFLANGVHYDQDQYGGVTSIRHEIANATIKTTLGIRGKPAGKYSSWRYIPGAKTPVTSDPIQPAQQVVQLRTTRISETADQVVVRVEAITPNANATVTVSYDAGGLTVSPATGGTIIATNALGTTAHIDYTITRDTQGGTPRRVAFTGSSVGFMDGTDGVDVPPNSTRNRCKLVITGTPNVATGTTPVQVTAWTEAGGGGSTDVGALHSDSVNPSRITIPTGGGGRPWRFELSLAYQANVTGDRFLAIYKNGTVIAELCQGACNTTANAWVGLVGYTDPTPSAADYFEAYTWQNSGGTLNISTGTSESFFSATDLF